MASVKNKSIVEIKANTNFHTATKSSVFDLKRDERFCEYRRRWYEYPANFIVGNFPLHLDIESSSFCNLRCPFCATTHKNWGATKEGFMDLLLFKRIIDEGIEHGLYSLKLSLRGEPLLHPQLPEMVSYAKEKGIIDVYFNTNATLLNEDKINQLISSGLDRISISLEGTTKEVYEKYRVGAKFEMVMENIRRLRYIRDSQGLAYPQIRIQTVLLPELKEGFPQYVEFWKRIADEVAYLDARCEGPADDHRGMKADWACPFLWQRMTILWDGTLLPCLMHGVSDFSLMSLGNVREVSIKEMWQGEKVSRYRELHRQGQAHKLKACDQCSYRAMEIEKHKMR
jgi:radical SAM protein with 4Fe4S-binding SPASM domain